VALVLCLQLALSAAFEENEESLTNASSSAPLHIAPTPSSGLPSPPDPSSHPPSTYFISGLANTIRRLNASLIAARSETEPFLLNFRTACPFGQILTDVSQLPTKTSSS
jgi:hypothetical protein